MTDAPAADPTLPDDLQVVCFSAEKTRSLGRCLGALIGQGLIIALIGELGAGKTAFVQGLANGLDVADAYVTSPTFSLVNAYQGRLPLWHADLYRLDGEADIEDIGLAEILGDGRGVVAVEWAERLDLFALGPRLEVHFTVTGQQARRIDLRGYGQAARDLLRRVSDFDPQSYPQVGKPSTGDALGPKSETNKNN